MTAPAIDLEAAAAALEASDAFRVLRRFVPRTRYSDEQWKLGDRSRTRLALYIDTETTDLDTSACDILEFGAVQFSYDAETGQVFAITDEYQGFEEPKRAIDKEAQLKHGITLDMVKGQRLDDEKIFTMLTSSAVIIAHNAGFDRAVVERRISAFSGARFACSYRDVEWERVHGCENAKLSTILAHTCGEFFDGHRALDDCRVGVHVLATAQHEGISAMGYLLSSARLQTIRLWAIGAPFDMKDALKARRYKWSDGTGGRPKAWYIDCTPDSAMHETKWLQSNGIAPRTTSYDAKDRFSVRAER